MLTTVADFDFFALLLEGAPDPVVVTDERGLITYTNRAAENFFSLSGDELRELPVVKLFPDWFHLPASCQNVLTEALLPDSSLHPISISLAPVQTRFNVSAVAIFRESKYDNDATEKMAVTERELRAQVRHQDESMASLQTELSDAAKILENHLPRTGVEGIDSAWIFRPSKTLGGDMLLIHRYDESRVLLGVLDVSGHGVAASLLSIGLVRSLSPEQGRGGCLISPKGLLRSPKEIVSRLNKESRILFESGLFVTLVFGVLDLPTRQFCFTCAGHPLPFRILEDQVSEIDAEIDPPLGIDENTSFRETSVVLEPGEALVLYTDGVTESRSKSGEFFGEERLKRSLSHIFSDFSSLPGRLVDTLQTFQEGEVAVDDVTMLAVRLQG